MFSGGKDSLAVLVWAKNNLPEFDVCFCDTGWENVKTYQHIADIERWLGQPIIILHSAKYEGFEDLSKKRKRVASTRARFCTEELKVKPSIDYVLRIEDDACIYQGVRAEESEARRHLSPQDEYFKFYHQPYGYDKKAKPKYHTYRKKEVLARDDKYTTDVIRPVLKWSAQEVFDYVFSAGLKVNPLYYEGFSRVGCFPCVMCSHREIKLIAENYPEVVEKIRAIEASVNGRSFFPPKYIPDAHCSRFVVSKDGAKRLSYPSIDDVITYVTDDANQGLLFDKPIGEGCISVYSICEKA